MWIFSIICVSPFCEKNFYDHHTIHVMVLKLFSKLPKVFPIKDIICPRNLSCKVKEMLEVVSETSALTYNLSKQFRVILLDLIFIISVKGKLLKKQYGCPFLIHIFKWRLKLWTIRLNHRETWGKMGSTWHSMSPKNI